MMLNIKEIERLIKKQGLIKDYINLEVQLTPNGLDLTVAEIYEFESGGAIDFSNKERSIPQGRKIALKKKFRSDKFGWWILKTGAYKIRSNESFNLPNDLIAIAFPRSSLLRSGSFTQTGVWDAGFKGKAEFILIVANKNGLKLKQNARIVQIIFSRINKSATGYRGIYQEL